jgi:vacuolar-type H+-ATPase subunit H
MDQDQDVLQHLLNLEGEAAALVDDAQAEADRRVAEGEKKNRALYDERYAAELETLETEYKKQFEAIKEDYRNQLEHYRKSLDSTHADTVQFYALAERLLLKGD